MSLDDMMVGKSLPTKLGIWRRLGKMSSRLGVDQAILSYDLGEGLAFNQHTWG
jgi:hypothetical protein